MKKAYIQINGGLGKNIAFSQITKEAKEVYDFIAVLSPYYDIFECCPYVDYVYKPTEVKDFISDAKNDEAEIFIDHIYDTSDFIYKNISYADAYRKMLHMKVKGNKNGSDTKTELEPYSKYPQLQNQVTKVLDQIKKDGYSDFVIVQFEGGFSPLTVPPVVDGKQDWTKLPKDYNEPLRRMYPYGQQFVDLFHQKYPNTAIINYALPNEKEYNNTYKFVMPYLTYYELAKLPECIGTISIDSSLQHLVAGNTKSTVVWAHSLPKSFGYEYNNNVIQKCNRNDILYFSQLGPSGARVDYIKPEKLLEIIM